MTKILGVEVNPKQKTDADYVELIRKMTARSKWYALSYGVCGCVYIAGCFITWRLISRELCLFPERKVAVQFGVELGVVLGLMLMMAMVCIGLIIYHIKPHRTERLMVKFYDELNRNKENCQRSPSSSTSSVQTSQS